MNLTFLYKIMITLAAIASGMAAKAASLPIGYCYGEIAETGLSKVGEATISGAAIIPAEVLSQYPGATISGIRVGLVTAEGVNNLRGWVRNELSGENLDETSFADPAQGWNEAAFAGKLMIDGNDIVVGFSFEQEKSVKCLSVVGENYDDARWIAKNDKWEHAKNEGALSLELIISGDNVPQKDLALLSVSSKHMPVKDGDDITLDIAVRNLALENVEGFDIAYSIDGEAVGTEHFDSALEYGQKMTIPFTIPRGDMEADKSYTLTVSASCEDDGFAANNTSATKIGYYTFSWPRRVLIEEFTTEKCPNCPRAINTLKQCEEAGYGDRMTVVAHHVGYNTDWLTVKGDEDYLWFYDPKGTAGTFAPAAMLDRTVLEGESVPVNSVGYFNDFEPILQQATEVPAFARLDISSSVDENLNVAVDIERLPILEAKSEMPRLTVYIIEDGILHHDQAGISSDSFTHSHVLRQIVTDIWGDPIEWNDDKAHCEFSVPVDSEWNMENVSVVAFVHDHDMMDVSKCNVHNSAVAPAGTSGVDEIHGDSAIVSTEYTTLSGIKASNSAKGVLIKTVTFENGATRVSKVIRR